MLCLTVVIAAILMGTLPIFVRSINMSPIQLSFFRLFFGFVFLGVILAILRERPRITSWKLIWGIVIINTLTVVSYIASIQLVEVATAALMLYMAPIYVIPLAKITGEGIHPESMLALPPGLVGLWLMLSPHNFSIGVISGLVSGLSYAAYFLLMKKARREMRALHITFVYLTLSSLMLLPSLFIEPIPEVSIPWLLGLGIIPTGLAFSLFNFGIKYCRVDQAPFFALIEPVAAGFFGYLFFGETLSWIQLIGACLILLSIAVAAREIG